MAYGQPFKKGQIAVRWLLWALAAA